MKAREFLSTTTIIVTLMVISGCVRYRFDVPNEMMQAPEAQVWGVSLEKSGSGYRTHSITKLNGAQATSEEPTTAIASGTTNEWQWEVKAVPSLLPSWKAWQNDKKVQLRSREPDDWSHPAASWEQGFARAYKVVSYLLGRPPVPMKLTLLLVADGTKYDKVFINTGTEFIPFTFAFYYPSTDSPDFTAARFSAFTEAVSRSVYEYQHVMDDSGIIKATGNNDTDKTINDESRSHCWFESTLLALTSGTHTEMSWNPPPEALLEGSSAHDTSVEASEQVDAQESGTRIRRYSNAVLWAKYLEAKSVSAYLKERGMRETKVVSNDPAAMNAVLSVCRAMTQQPLDLTAHPYPASQVQYVPFFPANFEHKEPKPQTNLD